MRENQFLGFPTRSDTNRPVQLHVKARSLKFSISEEERFYYWYSENRGTEFSKCTADQCLCIGIGRKPISQDTAYLVL